MVIDHRFTIQLGCLGYYVDIKIVEISGTQNTSLSYPSTNLIMLEPLTSSGFESLTKVFLVLHTYNEVNIDSLFSMWFEAPDSRIHFGFVKVCARTIVAKRAQPLPLEEEDEEVDGGLRLILYFFIASFNAPILINKWDSMFPSFPQKVQVLLLFFP